MSAKILIIDSDWPSVRALEKDLESRGFEVLSAPDGMMGVQRALREQPDVIVLEAQFPAGGPAAVFQRLKMSLVTRRIPILVYTGSTNAQDMRPLHELGLLTYIRKPNVEQLVSEIHRRLGNVVSSGDFQPPAPPSAAPIPPLADDPNLREAQ